MLFFAVYLFCGMMVSYVGVLDQNVYFGADNARAFYDLTAIDHDHYRIKVHPLLLILVQPVILLINGIVNYSQLAVILVEAACGAGMVAALCGILGCFHIRDTLRALIVLIFGFSSSTWYFSIIPETFIFSGLSLSLFWWHVIASVGKASLLRWKDILVLSAWGTICFGITLTNFASFLIGLMLLLWKRGGTTRRKVKLFAVTVALSLCLVIVLSRVQHFAWPQCPMFLNSMSSSLFDGVEYEEFRYTNVDLSLEKIGIWLSQTAFFPIISPGAISGVSPLGYQLIAFADYSSLRLGAMACLAALLLVAMGQVFIAHVTHRKSRDARTVGHDIAVTIGIAFGVNMALHFFYGYQEAFMYSPHYLFLLMILLAIAFDSVWDTIWVRRLVQIVLALFFLVEMCLNAVTIESMVRMTANMIGSSCSLEKALFVTILMGVVVWLASRGVGKRVDEGMGGKLQKIIGFSYGMMTTLVTAFVFVSY